MYTAIRFGLIAIETLALDTSQQKYGYFRLHGKKIKIKTEELE